MLTVSNDIVVDASTDGGRSWGAVGRANGDAPSSGIDHFTPEVAAHDGIVAVTYRTRDRNGTPSGFVGTETVVSRDGGRHFGAATVLGPPSGLALAAMAPVPFFGDYSALASTGHGFVAVWCASPDDPGVTMAPHQTTWAATITP